MTTNEVTLIVIGFLSSMLTAVIGIGGGLMLVTVMPSFLPPLAVIPVHGVVQLASNASRVAFGLRHTVWSILLAFVAGVVAGGALGSPILGSVPVEVLPVILGICVLLLVWIPRSWLPGRLPGGYFASGAVQAFLALFVGATGPLNAAFLAREELPRDQTVVTHGAMMTCVHLVKCLVFAFVGFAYGDYLLLLGGMVTATSLGSYVGTKLRPRLPETSFHPIFKVVVTCLALRLLWKAAIQHWVR